MNARSRAAHCVALFTAFALLLIWANPSMTAPVPKGKDKSPQPYDQTAKKDEPCNKCDQAFCTKLMYYDQYEIDNSGPLPIPAPPDGYVFARIEGDNAPVPVWNGVDGTQIVVKQDRVANRMPNYINQDNECKEYLLNTYNPTPPNLMLVVRTSVNATDACKTATTLPAPPIAPFRLEMLPGNAANGENVAVYNFQYCSDTNQ